MLRKCEESGRRWKRGAGRVRNLASRWRSHRSWGLASVGECLSKSLDQILSCGGRLELRAFACLHDRRNHRIEIRVHESRAGEPLPAGAVDDAMLGRGKAVVRPARQQVADVDHVRAGDRVGGDPVAVGILDLKPADVVLVKERQRAEIGVRRHSELLRSHRGRLRRIIDDRAAGDRLFEGPDEIVRLDVETCRKRSQQQLSPGGPLIRPRQRTAAAVIRIGVIHVQTPDEAFLQIGPRLVGHLCFPGPQEAAMGRVDPHLVLDAKGLGIERPRRRKHVVDQRLRHAVVLDVEEADGRSRSRQVVGYGFEPCGGSAVQLPDIDDRDRFGIDGFRRGVTHVRPSVGSNGAIRGGSRLTVAFLAAPFKPVPGRRMAPTGPLRPGKVNGYSAAARRGFATSSGFDGTSSNSSASMFWPRLTIFSAEVRIWATSSWAWRKWLSSLPTRSLNRPTSARSFWTSVWITRASSRMRASRTSAWRTWIASASSDGETMTMRARWAFWTTSSKCSARSA